MTDQDEFDELRDRIESIEEELGIDDPTPEERAEELVEDTDTTWFKADNSMKTRYYPAGDVSFECDDWNDADVNHNYDYCVYVASDGNTVGTYEDSAATLSCDIEPIGRSNVVRELTEAMSDE